MKNILKLSFFLVAIVLLNNSVFAQEKIMYSKQIPTNLIVTYKKTPIIYQPFTDDFIKQKQTEAVVKLPNGETITATEYATEINKAEEALNKDGVSIRDNIGKPVEISTLKNVQMLNPDIRNLNSYKPAFYSNKNATQLNALLSANMQQVQEASATQQTSAKSEKRIMRNPLSTAIGVQLKTPKDAVAKVAAFDFSFGDPETIYAGAFAKYEVTSHAEALDGVSYATSTTQDVVNAIKKTNSNFKMYVGTEGKFSVLGKEVKIFEASFTLDAPSNVSKKLSKKVIVYRFGKTLFNEDDTYDGDSKIIDKLIADTLNWQLADITIPIAGPFSVRTTFSIFGSVGMQYGCTLNRLGVSAAVRPYIITRAILEGSVGVGRLANIGVGGELTLLNAEVVGGFNTGLTWNNAGWILQNKTNLDLNLNILNGKLYGFAQVDVWGYHNRWEHNFCKLNGYNFNKNIISLDKSQSFTKWETSLQAQGMQTQ